MKDALLMVLYTSFFLIGVALVAMIVNNQKEPRPLDTTPRLLDCDADFYADKYVRVKTDGMETVDGELRYRRRTDLPYIVILRFKSKMPDKLPELVTGTCLGRVNGVVLVVDCR